MREVSHFGLTEVDPLFLKGTVSVGVLKINDNAAAGLFIDWLRSEIGGTAISWFKGDEGVSFVHVRKKGGHQCLNFF